MKHDIIRLCLAAALALTGVGAAQAENQIIFSYGDPAYTCGTTGKKAETVDVAMLLRDKALVGTQIRSIRVPFLSVEGLSGAKAWLSQSLPGIKSSKMLEPDICSVAFDIAEGYNEITLAEPYTITKEGVYVGYSFDMAASEEALKPIAVTGQTSPEGFLIHSTKIYRTSWKDQYLKEGQLCLQVLLAGDAVKTNAAQVVLGEKFNVKTGEPTTIDCTVINHGAAGITGIDYSVLFNGEKVYEPRHADLDIKAVFGAEATLQLTLPAIAQKGVYAYTISIDKVNGEANEELAEVSTNICAYNTLPVHRAVLEEYTGTWCGWCPRGFVGLEEMNRLFPKDFIGVSYHNSDPMAVTNDYPSLVEGFPDAWIDRWYQTDAFCGDSDWGTFGIDKVWQDCCTIFSPAAVEVSSQWTDDQTLRATASVTFPLPDDECPYSVGFVLTADGLSGTGSDWVQANNFSGDDIWPASMNLFTQGGSNVSGLTFNDVVIHCDANCGIEGSLTAPIEEDVAQTVDYDFDLSSISSAIVPADRSKLHVVALLIDTQTGRIVNANKAAAGNSSTAAITATSADKVVQSVHYVDLLGRRIASPRHGLYIRTETLRDGTLRTQKVRF